MQTCKNKFLCPKKANAHIIYRNIAVIFADVPCKTRKNVKKIKKLVYFCVSILHFR